MHRRRAIASTVGAAVVAGLIGLTFSCSEPGARPAGANGTDPVSTHATADDAIPFDEVAESVGLDFVHDNGRQGAYHLIEIMGSGVGLLDYDADGDLDVYLVQSGPLPQGQGPRPESARDRLYRNDVASDGNGLRFTDVTVASGLDARGYGMGVATGDYDGDGHVDLYVTNFGPNQLWRNQGDGTFKDVTAETGADDPRWSVSAAFFDANDDGRLDLYVGNYVDFTFATSKECFNKVRDYCSPLSYHPVPDRLLANLGDGRFRDVTAPSQLARAYGNALGVVSADFNGDDRIDLYVANDGVANQLWMNRGNGRFEDFALMGGAALNDQGAAEAGMGVSAADFDGDGDEDLFMTHLRGETNTVYRNDGTGSFVDDTIRTGLGPGSKPSTGFGTSFFDYDNDGWLDVLAVNGAVTVIEALVARGEDYPYPERNQLFRNDGGRGYVEVDGGPSFAQAEISRGAAFGDLDNDGDVDVVISNNAGPVRLLLNRGDGGSWIGLDVRLPSGAPALGARVELLLSDGRRLVRRVRSDGSYASAQDPRLLVGLGRSGGPVGVTVRPPGGVEWQVDALEPDRWHTVRSP